MNKFTVIVAVALVATSAFASKSRLGALQSSPHLQDTRDVFVEPDQAVVHGEFASMELSGNTSGANDAAPNAEGGFVRKLGENSALGAWIGNKTNLATMSLDTVTGTPKLQNPLNVYYASKMGDMTWGAGLNYSSAEDKAVNSKSSSMGLNASVNSAAGWEANLALGLTGEATSTNTTKYEQKSPISLNGGYWMDTMYVFGGYDMYGGKSKNIAAGTTTSEVDVTKMKIGVVNSHKKDGADFFYGVSYLMTSNKVKNGTKVEGTSLPVVIGIEADAASWMVLRASVTQNVLLGTDKTSPATGASTEKSMYDNTTVASGLGLKLGKFMVDGSLAATKVAASSGKLGSDTAFLSEVAVTYMF